MAFILMFSMLKLQIYLMLILSRGCDYISFFYLIKDNMHQLQIGFKTESTPFNVFEYS